jgi:hypothetical protein
MPQTNLPIPFTQMTPVATTSGTFIDFTNIPSGVKRITVSYSKVQQSGASYLMVQLAVGGVPVTTGYQSTFANTGSGGTNSANITTGFGAWAQNAIDTPSGSFVITNVGGNQWVYAQSAGLTNGTNFYGCCGGGNITLSGALTGIRFTTFGGTNTFTSGEVAVTYE